ncbi:hypothetical protein BJ508DRAFT_367647 [Ascobolus immersus RN42]|uniref:Uncharacterized protein n=1 Tax=Ascobolus immersus RN42 TaxID=1160509 RepID=A0A3N4HPS7_ASCIM|nr:hypothetical protein BJ508DRAFT_367647 [Ascobolus immersus RN42]
MLITLPLLSTVLTIASAATIQNIAEIQKRQTNGAWAKLCIDADFNGRCFYTVQKGSSGSSGCQNLASGDNDKISSIKVATGAQCIFYKDASCSGGYIYETSKGDQLNLKYWGDGTFNDKISSYSCSNEGAPLGCWMHIQGLC